MRSVREHTAPGVSSYHPRMAWNWMQAKVVADDRTLRPMIGPGGLSREEAHREIQQILDQAGAPLASIAERWRRGAADDTVFAGLLTWCIYGHPDGEDPRVAALAWLEDYAQTMRSTGLDVQVARLS